MSTNEESTTDDRAGATTAEERTRQLAIDAIRVLSMDAVQKAESGHPGTPMALAPVGYVLFHRYPASSESGVARPRSLHPRGMPPCSSIRSST